MKITNQKCVDTWEITGLPPGEYDLTVTGSNAVGQASLVVHESIPGPELESPVEPVVEP